MHFNLTSKWWPNFAWIDFYSISENSGNSETIDSGRLCLRDPCMVPALVDVLVKDNLALYCSTYGIIKFSLPSTVSWGLSLCVSVLLRLETFPFELQPF